MSSSSNPRSPALSNSPFFALYSLLTGITLIAKPGIRRFVGAPLFFNVLLYSFGYWLAARYFSILIAWITTFIPNWANWLHWLLWPLFGLSFLLLIFFSFTLIANLIGAPFYGRLAEKVESALTGQTEFANVKKSSWPVESVKAIKSELNRQGYFLIRAVPLLILFVIPILNLLAPFLWLIFSAWFLALEYLSYPLENRGLFFSEQRRISRNSPVSVTAFGGLIVVALTIPILNILIPPAAVAGATAFSLGKRS